ncbi:MAG: BBE domain-containing protein, partial [Acidimicrobiales bacterium]
LGAPMPDAGTAAVVDAVEALAQQAPQAGGGFVFDSYGGAINRVPAAATAFVHRHQLAGVQYSVTWSSGAPGSMPAVATAWLSQSERALAPYTDGAYQNYVDPTLADWEHAYYGTNLARLVRVKRAVDPDDVFTFPQSIPLHLPRR